VTRSSHEHQQQQQHRGGCAGGGGVGGSAVRVPTMTGCTLDAAFRAIPRHSTCFLIWRVQVNVPCVTSSDFSRLGALQAVTYTLKVVVSKKWREIDTLSL